MLFRNVGLHVPCDSLFSKVQVILIPLNEQKRVLIVSSANKVFLIFPCLPALPHMWTVSQVKLRVSIQTSELHG